MPEIKISLDELNEKIGKLYPMPETLARVLQELQDPNADAGKIEKTLKYDPKFSFKILSLANSAFYGQANKISNIHAAITLLGFASIKSLAIQCSADQFFSQANSAAFQFGQSLWKHSVGVGVCAKMISRRLRIGNAEDFFTLGILHDMGLFIENELFYEKTSEILKAVQADDRPLFEIENEIFGIDHPIVTALLCEKWTFPNPVLDILKYHHAPTLAPSDAQSQVSVLNLADKLTMQSDTGFVYPHGKRLDIQVMEILKMDALGIEVLKEDLLEELGKHTAFFNQG